MKTPDEKSSCACLVGLALAALMFGLPECVPAQPMPGDVNGDGHVDRLDIELIAAARNTPASGPTDPRDINKDGIIDAIDVRLATGLCTRPNCALPAASIVVDSSPTEITLQVGQTANVSTNVTYTTLEGVSQFVAVSQTVEPNNGGITLLQGIGPGFHASSNVSELTNQTVRANAIGNYLIKTKATIANPPTSRESAVLVRVVASLMELTIDPPAAYPPTIPPNATTPVRFSVSVSGYDPATPPSVQLELNGMPPLPMNDHGTGSDLVPGDGVYTASADLTSNGMLTGQCIAARAKADRTVSGITQVCVSSLPVGAGISNIAGAFTDPATGHKVVPDEILITFKPGVTEAQMQAVVAGLPGAITGSFLPIPMVQAKLATTPATLQALLNIIATLLTNPLVESASTNAVGSTSAVVPNDTHYGLQWALPKVRADEAWVITRGGPLIAVLDTGVDGTHPDLLRKVINFPWDFGNGDSNPVDIHGHGTHVAGIAAARSNNATGVAGVAWNSPILNVKVLSDAGPGTDAAVIAGVSAAVAWGAQILNLSLGNFSSAVCPAINMARFIFGRMVVSAAGNNATSAINYPGGCAGSFAVGNTTAADGRAAGSNFGAWVDIAAPGTNIFSTVPGGDYAYMTGTSMAAPLVAGAAALVLSRQRGLSAGQVEYRLRRTAEPLPAALQLGAGRIDIFEAVFNGSFEEPSLALWNRIGTASSIASLGRLAPRHRRRMLFVSTGPAGAQVSGSVWQTFTVQPGVTNIPLKFSYTFVSEEYPEWVGTIFDDALKITLETPTGATVTLVDIRVNTAAFGPISGINFPGGDDTVGWTGWTAVSLDIPVTAGPGTYRIFITDAGDAIYDTAALVDRIRFK